MTLARFAVDRPVTLGMLTLSMVVLGVISFTRIPLEQMPSISSSTVSVSVSYPSSSPEEVERAITVPLEQSLAILSGIQSISSTSSASSASVRVEFQAGTDMDLATMEVRDRVDQVRGLLPPEVDRVNIRRWQTDERSILYARIAWRGEGERLLDVVRKVIEPRLLRIEGVVNVTVDGMDQKQLIVRLDQQRLEAHDVSLAALAAQVRDNNVDVSLGRVLDGGQRYQVRARGEFDQVEQIGDLPLARSSLRLSDLGEVSYDYPEKRRYERLDGVDAVAVEVYKGSTDNVVDVAGRAHAVLDEIAAEYGDQLQILVAEDRAETVLAELGNLRDTAFMGGFLAIAIIFLFLRSVRSTLVIAVAIPVSVACVFTGLYLARELFDSTVTLNMVSMMGLMLAVGMLVDPAVVTLESIYRRRQEEGVEPMAAAVSGAGEIGMAVLASSLTTMCVFIPFFFATQSRMTTWMRDAGLTICLAVAVSTVVSLALIPLGASRIFRDEYGRFDGALKVLVALLVAATFGWKIHEIGWPATARWMKLTGGRLVGSVAGMEWTTGVGLALVLAAGAAMAWRFKRRGMRSSYVSLLTWTLDHRALTLVAAVLLIVLGNYLYGNIQQQGTPWQPERRVDITVEVERSYSLEEVRQLFAEYEQLVLARRQELDVESVRTRFGQRGGTLSVQLVQADAGHLSTMAAGAAVQKLLPERVGVVYRMGRSRSWSGNTLGVEVQIKGPNQDVLAILAEEVASHLARLPGVKDVDTSLEDSEEEIRVEVDREQALEYGLSPRAVASSISAALGTRRTTTYKTGEREIDVVLQLEDEDRTSLEELKNTRFEGRNDTRIQLGALADFRFAEGPHALRREDRLLTLNVFANTADQVTAMRLMQRDKETGRTAVEELMDSIPLPSGFSWQMGRVGRWMREDTAQNNFTLLFALLIIYLIMASLFESLVHPFTIMFSIPFSLIGVALGLWAFDVPFDNNGVLGLLILFGIVVNNGIVLVDHINHYRREGLSRRAAILRGGQNRMRPILMTALTTILNLVPLVLPMIYGTSEGFARRWGPVGLVVMSGLASSTVLTLIFAPTLYSLLDDLALWMRRVARATERSH